MTLKIMPRKVSSKSVSTSIGELTRGHRLAHIEEDRVPQSDLREMITKLRNLAHVKDQSSHSVNQTNQDSLAISQSSLSHAISLINVHSDREFGLEDGILMAQLNSSSNVLRFKAN